MFYFIFIIFRRGGLQPFNIHKLLGQCPRFHAMSEANVQKLIPIVYQLANDATRIGTGRVSDADMYAALAPLGLATPIENMDERCINQQRALLINAGWTIAKYREGLDKKRRDKDDKERLSRAAIAKNEKKVHKAAVVEAEKERVLKIARLVAEAAGEVDDRVIGPPPSGQLFYCGNPGCVSSYHNNDDHMHIDGEVVAGSTWKGCPSCKDSTNPFWVCCGKKKKCEKVLTTHVNLCKARAAAATAIQG